MKITKTQKCKRFAPWSQFLLCESHI